MLVRLPRQVERVDRDAVTSEARARIEWHETERLGLGRVDDFPDVDLHGPVDELQLVGEGDVDGPEHVLGDLDRLGHIHARHRDRLLDDRAVQRLHQLQRVLAVARDDLGDRGRVEIDVAGVLPFGGEADEEVRSADQAASLEDRLQHLAGGSGIGRGLKDDHLAAPQPGRHRLAGRHDV